MIEIQYCQETPSASQFFALFETTGWNAGYQASPEDLEKCLAQSWLVVAAYDGEHLVGVGRVVTDQVMHAMIYDLIVDPAYQGRGIGGQILDTLVKRCREANIHDIQLFCAQGKRTFYEEHGFEARPTEAPGMQYRHV